MFILANQLINCKQKGDPDFPEPPFLFSGFLIEVIIIVFTSDQRDPGKTIA